MSGQGKETAAGGSGDLSRVGGNSGETGAQSAEAAPQEKVDCAPPGSQDPKNVQELTTYIQSILQQMQDRFTTMSDQIIGRIDDMAARIDDLEHNINDLMVQAGPSDTTDRHALPEPK